jgi:hypothetical protein
MTTPTTLTSRRTLLRAGAIGAILWPLVPSWFAPATAGPALYSRGRFAKLLKARFTLVGAGHQWRVTLTKVTDLPGAPHGDSRRFNLTFHCSVTGPPQGVYHLKRAGFTTTTLFLVPSDASRRTYQAVINRA